VLTSTSSGSSYDGGVSKKKQPGADAPDTGFSAEAALAEVWEAIEAGHLLEAEVQVAGLLALPTLNRSTRADAQTYVAALITTAARLAPRSSAAAFYRLLMALGSPTVKKLASGALRQITAEGAYPPGWVTEIGKPVPGEAWRRYDVFGDDEAIVVTFAYGEQRHAILVRVDRTVLPTATSVGVSPEPDRLVEAVSGEAGPTERAGQISLAEARQRIEAPLARATQSGARGLTPSSATFLPVVRLHARRLAADSAANTAANTAEPPVAYTAADRAAAVAAFLASPQAAEAGDPEVARYWAQALTGYSGRVPGEPPAQVGPRKIAAMLGHVAGTFTLTDAQRAGMGPAVTAWVTWATEHQGLDEAAAAQVLTVVPKALDEFTDAYDDPRSVLARAYVSDLSTPDADVTELAAAVIRRSVAVPFPDARNDGRDGEPGMDVTDPAARAVMVATEFATCHLDEGQAREALLAGATRIVEELWSGEPPATWEKARQLLTDGRTRHEAIHALVGRTR
jgi:hypothetical protein